MASTYQRCRSLSSSSPTPLRFLPKPLHKKSDVQATNSKAASVKTLSSWMDGDPFQQKKVRTIRSGHNVIVKSRIFEKEGASLTVRKECVIRAGSVNKKSAWLSEAFKSEGGEEKPQSLLEKKIRPYQYKPKESTSVKELKSVRDRKKWLNNAFIKSDEKEAQQLLQHSIIYQTKSFDIQVNNDATNPGIMKCASADDGTTHHPPMMIQQTKSCDGMRPPPSCDSASASSSLERQHVVCLYQNTPKKGEEEKSPEETLTTVHDKQAWVSSVFKKPISGCATAADGKEDTEGKKWIEAPLNIIVKNTVDEESLDKHVVRAVDKKSPEKILKTVHNKQAWLSSRFKKPSGSATANGKEDTEEEKLIVEAPLHNIVKKSVFIKKPSGSDEANGKEDTEEKKMIETNSVEKTVDEKLLDKHVAEATKTKEIVSGESKKDKMSVADRAKWLKAAFK